MSWGRWSGFPSTGPIPVKDGLRTRSQRGAIGDTWWSQRFVATLEAMIEPERLARGRDYARSGQVRTVEVHQGAVLASVQGSWPRPYDIAIELQPLTDAQWRAVADAMAARAVFLARLLAGEMPHEIGEAFAAAGVSLFPARARDLRTDCSCPDAANPCKHIAAVYYLLAERFDEDPFLLFTWRGRPKDRLLAELRALRPPLAETAPAQTEPDDVAGAADLDRRAAARTPDGFWRAALPPEQTALQEPEPDGGEWDVVMRELPAKTASALTPAGVEVIRRLYTAVAAHGKRGPSR